MHPIFYILIAIVSVFLILTVVIVAKLFFGSLKRQKEKNTGVDTSVLTVSLEPYKDEIKAGKEWYLSQNLRKVEIEAFDGVTLRADVFEAENPKGILLLMHGYRTNALNDFTLVYSFYHNLGYHLIAPDQRACGKSDGEYITLGIKERFDCQSWANFAAKEFGEDLPLVLDGISMGATTVMMASELPLPKNMSGLIADCGFTSPYEVVLSVLKATRIPVFPNLQLAEFLARGFAKFGFKDASTIDAMKKCRYPVFFIHGKKDDFVPYEMSVRNFEACASEKKKFFSVDEAGHGMCYLTKRSELEHELITFLDDCQEFYRNERK